MAGARSTKPPSTKVASEKRSKRAAAAATMSAATPVTEKVTAKKTLLEKTPAKKTPAKKRKTTKTPTASTSASAKTATKKTGTKISGTKKSASAEKLAAATTAAAKSNTPRKVVADPLVGNASTKSSRKKSVTEKQDKPKFLSDKTWLDARLEELTAERKRYTHNAEALAAEAAELMADRDPGDVQFDEESGEGDTLAVERDRDLALSAQAREKVDEIDNALERLERGIYGQCIVGGEGDYIPQERLEALPMAPKCIAHQTAMF